MTHERVKKAIDVRWVSSREVGGCKSATLRPVRAAIHNAGTTCKEKKSCVEFARRDKFGKFGEIVRKRNGQGDVKFR